MSEIKPALRPDEWAMPSDKFSGPIPGFIDWEDGTVDVQGGAAGIKGERFRHMLAALALHGQPFGFTREDLATIRKGFDLSDDQWRSETEAAAASLYARIEALLPPESA